MLALSLSATGAFPIGLALLVWLALVLVGLWLTPENPVRIEKPSQQTPRPPAISKPSVAHVRVRRVHVSKTPDRLSPQTIQALLEEMRPSPPPKGVIRLEPPPLNSKKAKPGPAQHLIGQIPLFPPDRDPHIEGLTKPRELPKKRKSS